MAAVLRKKTNSHIQDGPGTVGLSLCHLEKSPPFGCWSSAIHHDAWLSVSFAPHIGDPIQGSPVASSLSEDLSKFSGHRMDFFLSPPPKTHFTGEQWPQLLFSPHQEFLHLTQLTFISFLKTKAWRSESLDYLEQYVQLSIEKELGQGLPLEGP